MHAKLPVGTWIALRGVFDIASASANVVACELYDPAKAAILDIGEASESSVAGFPTTGTNLTVVTANRARVVEGDCGEDLTGPDGVSTAASWLFLRP